MSTDKTDADIAFVRALAQILNDNDLGEIEVEREFGEGDELKIRLTRSSPVALAPAPTPVYAAPAQAAPQLAAAPDPVAAQGPGPAGGADADAVPSPMVGTVYLAPEPDAGAFVKVGDTVTQGQTILIIEAMKTMNQIPAPRAGTVTAIHVSDAEPVEYGSPLMTIA
jgi:acetyl-CoA carboxylase biotin carboxyl carrier protein